MTAGAPTRSRRAVLASVAGAAASSLAGCSERLWSRAENDGPEQVELTIKTLPTDDDELAATILNQFRENLREAGIAVTHEPVSESELYRDILLERDYDVFVARHPGLEEYDDLYGLLHSKFVSERGWQNPFHFSDITADDYLERQRSIDGSERREMLDTLFEYLDETAPYTTIAFPYRIGGARDAIELSAPPRDPIEFLDLCRREPADGPRDGPLEVGIFGEELGTQLNPLTVNRSRVDGLLGLLYAPLARRTDAVRDAGSVTNDGAYTPWLAEDISWSDGESLEATVRLREGLTWHDETDLDADDVAFTYRFLQDTSMGDVDGGLPASQYRSQGSLVEDIEATGDTTVHVTFDTTVRAIAERALSVPILPRHVWEPRSTVIADHQTEALVDENEDPVGSGLFVLEDVSADAIELAPFEEHVFRDESVDRPAVLEGFSQFSGLRYQISPNVGSMIDALLEGEIDVTASTVPPSAVEEIRDGDETSLIAGPTDAFYMIGFNLHHPALGNPNVRRILSRLIDREHVVTELFDGLAEPAMGHSSLLGIRNTEWTVDDRSTVSRFPGTDGAIDADRVRSLFEAEGYRYEDGELLD